MEAQFPLNLVLFNLVNASESAPDLVILIAKGFAVLTPWVLIVGFVWYWIFETAEIRRSLMIAGITLGVGLIVNFTLSFLFYMPRPFELGVGTSFLTHSIEASFPSDHATFVWSLGFGLAMTRPLRRLGQGIICLGLIVAWSRVYLGVHFPLDMLASFVISFLSARFVKRLFGMLDQILFQPIECINSRIFAAITRQKK